MSNWERRLGDDVYEAAEKAFVDPMAPANRFKQDEGVLIDAREKMAGYIRAAITAAFSMTEVGERMTDVRYKPGDMMANPKIMALIDGVKFEITVNARFS